MTKRSSNTPLPPGLSGDRPPAEAGQQTRLDRRKFLKLFTGGLAVAVVWPQLGSVAGATVPPGTSPVSPDQVGAWIHIGEDGSVTVYTGKVEVGQNIRTSLTQAVAEELHVPVSAVTLIMADTDLVPYDAGTFGSRSTPQMGSQLRKAAATARVALIDVAAKNWNTAPGSLQADQGMVTDSQTGKKAGYGELTKGTKLLLPVSDQVKLTAAADWKVNGKTMTKVNGRSFITGRHKYVFDMKLPGMLFGKVLRPPSYDAKLVEADVSKAQAIPGVVVVHDGDFIGVAAPHLKTAEKALAAIKATWKETGRHPANADIFDYLVANVSTGGRPRNAGNTQGNVEEGLAAADHTLAKTYHIDYIAHVPLEPRAAVAEWVDGKLTVWTGTQRPFGVQGDLAGWFRLPKEKVRVIVPDTGSGYGGKHTAEAATEAARLAQAAKKPVKVVWTRKEEFTWAYFRPAGVIEVKGGVKKDGAITAWTFQNYNSGPAAMHTQYTIPHQQIAHIPCNTPLQQGSYRGLAATANVFARESHIADLACLVSMDQLAFRLRNLDDPRMKAVLETAAKSFGWNNTAKPPGYGRGLACGFDKGGYVATCAEVTAGSDGKIRVVRLTQAFECGAIVNPLHLENQVMGSIVQGLGGALFESVAFAEGKILNPGISTYRVPRFSDMPDIEIITIDRKDLPSAGAGEAAIICVVPAIRNAILDATGTGLNRLPLIPKGLLA